eukprot:CAMPEP_0198274068 /NCGR_PEP_ID=MMETSP1447-20131203/59019_1 /TAXON_ID=420782 /ORGANISM="Chaetoceros dichaeta, Strain CCMP1751" /LENGTH=51 /DNA_ID=CAMNT_0043968033 /DNA_START=92 /DNA_END=243 /DNA_ORIENTATION=+
MSFYPSQGPAQNTNPYNNPPDTMGRGRGGGRGGGGRGRGRGGGGGRGGVMP